MTQIYLTTEEPSLGMKYDAGTVRERLRDSVLSDGVHYLRPSENQVREDKEFYIPDLLSGERYESTLEEYSAAMGHAKHLYKAQDLLGAALNLVGLLLAALGDEGDSRAMQIEAALKVIEKKLSKAYTRIDKHEARHTNLFLVYFDLREKTDGGEQV